MAEVSEESAFSRLPQRLQESFLELADHVTRKLSGSLRREEGKLKELELYPKFRKVFQKIGGDLGVKVVDGSISLKLSGKLSFRVGVYAVAYMVFDGEARISDSDEGSMKAGYLIAPQTGSLFHAKKILNLLLTLFERKLALRCLKEYGADLTLIDGSFYGLRVKCSELKDKRLRDLGVGRPRLDEWGVETRWNLVKRVYDLVNELEKAVAIIKRVRASAIDGWLLSRSWSLNLILNRNDQAIKLGDEVNLGLVLAYLLASGDLVTGLLFPMDLIDEVIFFDGELVSELADEIEAKLLLSLSVDDVHGDFESINPLEAGVRS